MALFKKKQAIDAMMKQEQADNIEVGKEPTPKKELSPEAKILMAKLTEYKTQYHGVYQKADFGILDSDAEVCNLLFAIFGELKELRKDLERLSE